MTDAQKTLQIVYGQIGLLALFGCSLILTATFRPHFYEVARWAPGGAVVLLALNIFSYLRRYEKAAQREHLVNHSESGKGK